MRSIRQLRNGVEMNGFIIILLAVHSVYISAVCVIVDQILVHFVHAILDIHTVHVLKNFVYNVLHLYIAHSPGHSQNAASYMMAILKLQQG